MEIVNKTEETQEVNVKAQTQESNEASYEQLKNWCDQLLMQRNQLVERLRQITNIQNKLPWLFKVIENKEIFKKPFVQSCIEEVTYILTPQEQDETDTEDSKE